MLILKTLFLLSQYNFCILRYNVWLVCPILYTGPKPEKIPLSDREKKFNWCGWLTLAWSCRLNLNPLRFFLSRHSHKSFRFHEAHILHRAYHNCWKLHACLIWMIWKLWGDWWSWWVRVRRCCRGRNWSHKPQPDFPNYKSPSKTLLCASTAQAKWMIYTFPCHCTSVHN